MRTVIVRLAGSSLDGDLHGVAEIVGQDEPVPFAGDQALLTLLRRVDAGREDDGVADLNPT